MAIFNSFLYVYQRVSPKDFAKIFPVESNKNRLAHSGGVSVKRREAAL